MVGDRVNGQAVTGFTYVSAFPPRGHPAAEDDRLLLEGDEDLSVPPQRPLPRPDAAAQFRVERCGLTPLQRLPKGQAHAAGNVAGHLEGSMARVVFGTPPGGRFYSELIPRVERPGHQIWVAGGAVRDLIADGGNAAIKDLDFAGTAPPGLMSEMAYEALVRMDLSDVRPKVSGAMICSVQLPGSRKRLFEYKPLTLKGYRFPAFGGDLHADAATRDLTVNTLLFDLPRRNRPSGRVLDPLGRALADLCGERRVLAVPYAHDDPVEQATILLRAIKFVARWTGDGIALRLDELLAWIAALPEDLVASIPAAGWDVVRVARKFTLGEISPDEQRRTAERLGGVPAALIAELDARRTR